MEPTNTPVSAPAAVDVVVPQAVQTFTDVDSYKEAKAAVIAYANKNPESIKGVHYFRLFEEYKRTAHYYIVNGKDVPEDFVYTLSSVGMVNAIKIRACYTIRRLVVEGATFLKDPTVLRSGCEDIELRNCTWNNSSVSIARCCGKVTITLPIGTPVISYGVCNNGGKKPTLSSLKDPITLAKLIALSI